MNPPVIVIFGITGDLSKRKLLPALYHLLSQNVLPETTRIIGISRHDIVVDELLDSVELCVLEKDNVCDPVGIGRLRESLQSLKLDPSTKEDFQKLSNLLNSYDSDTERIRLIYMSVPPAAYAPVIEQLAAVGLNDERTHLLLEKPFGYDTKSAAELISIVDKHFNESQIYRIDHYLAKETAQNLLTFRINNPIFNKLWNSENIESVYIRAIEKIGIEGRAEFYEKTGAVRDLIQSHLMQLLALTLMKLPADMNSESIHTNKQEFLDHLDVADPQKAVRAQYKSYREEVTNSESNVETYAKISLSHTSDQWQGVELILETGKGLIEKLTEITVSFKSDNPHSNNNLRFQLQPHEGIILDLIVKQPGLQNKLSDKSLDFFYDAAFSADKHIDAYERVLIDAVRGDQALFASAREVEATWRVLEPIIQDWSSNGDNLLTYESGATAESITSNN